MSSSSPGFLVNISFNWSILTWRPNVGFKCSNQALIASYAARRMSLFCSLELNVNAITSNISFDTSCKRVAIFSQAEPKNTQLISYKIILTDYIVYEDRMPMIWQTIYNLYNRILTDGF